MPNKVYDEENLDHTGVADSGAVGGSNASSDGGASTPSGASNRPSFSRGRTSSSTDEKNEGSEAGASTSGGSDSSSGFYRNEDSPSDLGQKENAANAGPATSGDRSEQDKLNEGGFYKEDRSPSRRQRLSNKFSGMSSRKKYATGAAVAAGATGIVGIIVALFGLLGIFRLDHFMKNIEAKSFIRYQVDMEGRSSKWVNAYIALRLAEVDGPEAPKDRDNILFRANRVDTNNPTTDWYRTLRASKFEQEIFEKQGIKFASFAYKDGDIIKFRPAKITFRDDDITFNLTNAEIRAIETGDVNRFNGRLANFIDIEVLDSNKEGRKAVKAFVKDNTKSYQYMKRFFMRKAIQNQTGIRNWRFFENTRDKMSENTKIMRNRIILKSLPEDSKSGKVARCLFGLATCTKTPDPNSPSNRSALQTVDGTDVDEDSSDGDSRGSNSVSNKLVKSIVSKFIPVANVASAVEQLETVDSLMKDGGLTTAVYAARAASAVGVYSTMGIAASQLHTGELSSAEANQFMQELSHAGTSEGWSTVIANNGSSGSKVSAATEFKEAKSKDEYCDPIHQEEMLLPENQAAAQQEYHYLCPEDKIGAATRAEDIQNGWNHSLGFILKPLLTAYKGIPGVEFLVETFGAALDAIIGPIVQGLLKTLGLSDNVEDLMAWVFGKVASFLGAGPLFDTNSPNGVVTNHVIQGGGATAETAMRFSGGAVTNAKTKQASSQRVMAYQQTRQAQKSLFAKYLDLDEPDSVVSSGLYTAASSSPVALFNSGLRGLLSPSVFSTQASAATASGYEVSSFAGLITYDLPPECTESNPLNSLKKDSLSLQTNADDLGLIDTAELTWELLASSQDFYDKLYELNDQSAKIMEVYNCASLDSMARGAVAGSFSPELAGPNAIDDEAASTSAGASGSGGNLRVSSFNIFYSTGGKPQLGTWQERLKKSTDLIEEKAIQVVGLQEVRKDQYDRMREPDMLGTEDYGYCPQPYGSDYAAQNPIVWFKPEVELIECKTIPGYQVLGPKSLANTQVRLKLKSTGQEFYLINHHEPVGGGAAIKQRYDSAVERTAYVKELSKQGLPVFLTGDFNSGYDNRAAQPTWQNDRNNISYCLFTNNNLLWDAYDAAKNKKGKCPSNDGYGVDHIYMSTSVQTKRFDNSIGPQRNGSDVHNTMIADVVMPDAGQGR